MTVIQMSVVADSPVHSSSSDDFAAYLDEALDANSSNSSSDEEVESEDEFEDVRCSLSSISFYMHHGISFFVARCDFTNL